MRLSDLKRRKAKNIRAEIRRLREYRRASPKVLSSTFSRKIAFLQRELRRRGLKPEEAQRDE